MTALADTAHEVATWKVNRTPTCSAQDTIKHCPVVLSQLTMSNLNS